MNQQLSEEQEKINSLQSAGSNKITDHKLVRIAQCAPVYDNIIHKLVCIDQCAPVYDFIIHKLVRIDQCAPLYEFYEFFITQVGMHR